MKAWNLENLQNIGFCVTETARRMPNAISIACPRRDSLWTGMVRKMGIAGTRTQFDTITFEQLEVYSNRIVAGLQQQGLPTGTRLALMIPPGIDFVAWVFGLFKAGMVVVLIDPGMGRQNIIRCLAEVQPEGMVGIPLAHVIRKLFAKKLPRCRSNIVLGRFPGCVSAHSFDQVDSDVHSSVEVHRESPAAIIFTTGSTGPPKGVLYRHRIFIEQAEQIRDYFDIQPGSVDVSGFPLFALFNTAMGVTTVFPKMDATRPAKVYPPEIIWAANQFQADQSFGSPALWNTVTKYCEKNSVTIPTIKTVLTAGAPVSANLLDKIKRTISPDGEVYTPYGATESLPVACNSASNVLGNTAIQTAAGKGTCVGNRFPRIEWRVIRISDHPIALIDDCEILGNNQIGELIVKGPVVTDQYVTRLEANAEHKIKDGDTFWHRMGDVGYLDDEDQFWFCGRKSHRVITTNQTLFSIPCEAIINNHPDIYRCALVGVGLRGQEIPVIIAEPFQETRPKSKTAREKLLTELKELAAANSLTLSIKHFFLMNNLPVDIRHNSKIFREKLRPWAAKKLSSENSSCNGIRIDD